MVEEEKIEEKKQSYYLFSVLHNIDESHRKSWSNREILQRRKFVTLFVFYESQEKIK